MEINQIDNFQANDKLNQLLLENKILKSNLNSIEKQYQNQSIKFKDLSNQFSRINQKTEEYKNQLQTLHKTIEILKFESKEMLLKNSELEEKLFRFQEIEISLENGVEIKRENDNKIQELRVLLKESRKQNVNYSNQIKELTKEESNKQKLQEENTYLHQENVTLKAFIVSQNRMSHYGNAFKTLDVEQYCVKCSCSLLDLCQKMNSIDSITDKIDSDVVIPETNNNGKDDFHSSVDRLKNSILYTITVNDKETRRKKIKDSEQSFTPLPKVNKSSLKRISDQCDLSIESIDAIMRTIFHLGDQIKVFVEGNADKPIKSTIKYIGNLDDRYRSTFFLGVKLHQRCDCVTDSLNDGTFRKKRFFNIDSLNGYFLHFSNVVSVYNKETAQFEELGTFLRYIIDPTLSRNIK